MKISFVHNLQRLKTEAEAEFDTPEVIDAIASGLAEAGHEISLVEMTRDGDWINRLVDDKPDLIFNTAEGFAGVGRESYAPVVFEQLGLPFVGSGSYTCFLTLDKFLTKQIVARNKVLVPPGFFVSRMEDLESVRQSLEFPVFVKPNFEGSSKGITKESKCLDLGTLKDRCEALLLRFPEGLLVESFIEGRDVTVPFVSGIGEAGVLDAVEYLVEGNPDSWIYDYNFKNESDHLVSARCPALLGDKEKRSLQKSMGLAVSALGVADMARADFRVTPTGSVYFIELNALPSLQPGAGLFEASKIEGLNYSQTLDAIIRSAQKRHQLKEHKFPMRHKRRGKPNLALVYNMRRKRPGDEGYEQEAEFDSEKTVNAIRQVIESNGYPVKLIEAGTDVATDLSRAKIDVVFNIAEGSTGKSREAQIPAICDLLGIEHTGSDATCLALTLDKALSCRIAGSEGISVPRSILLSPPFDLSKVDLCYPLILKPNHEGTSKGIHDRSVLRNFKELESEVASQAKNYGKQLLLQEYIEGREFTVGVLGNQRLKVMKPLEIVFKKAAGDLPVYSFEHKHLDDQLDNEYLRMECPAELTSSEWKEIQHFAQKTFRALGCRDVARLDFRKNDRGLFFIEINPLPGLSPGFSDLVIMAEKQGISYEKLIASILRPAVMRWKRKATLYG